MEGQLSIVHIAQTELVDLVTPSSQKVLKY